MSNMQTNLHQRCPNMDAPLNPFRCGRPITNPAEFYGRTRELNRLRGHLRQLHWVSIVGPRGIGKTSLLLYLSNPLAATALGLDPAQYTMTYVDAQGLESLDAEHWYQHLIDCASQALGVSPISEVGSSLEFRKALQELLTGGRKLILMIDEFEAMAGSKSLTPAFFNLLRSLSTAYSVVIITASRSSLADLVGQNQNFLSSPFFNAFNVLSVGLLDNSAARALVGRAEAAFPPEVIDFLVELAGPHPGFLQFAGYYAFERQREGRLNTEALQAVQEDLKAAMKPRLEYGWKHLRPEARYALAVLPLAPPDKAESAELHEACWLRDGAYLSSLVEHFVRQQILPDVLQVGSLVVDLRRLQVAWRGKRLNITGLPFEVLCYLMQHPNQAIESLKLEAAVWAPHEGAPVEPPGNPERVEAAVKRLRSAFPGGDAKNLITSRLGMYTLDTRAAV